MSLTQSIIQPIHSVAKEVSHHYSSVLYKYLLTRRDQKHHYETLMKKAMVYEQWAAAGYMLDRCEGKDKWKDNPASSHYDHGLLKDRLDALRNIRKEGDTETMMYNLRTSICRNLGDMGNVDLYEYTHVGTKALIEDYIDETTKQLNFICDVDIPGVSLQQKLDFFTNTHKAFGRTALLLSGGGTFGLSHIGVVKCLWEMKLLPRIISGSSAGSIVASVLCTRTDEEMIPLLNPAMMNLDVFERPYDHHNPFVKLQRFLKHGVLLDIEVFIEAMRSNLGDVTFQEAYNRTRRILNITVSSPTNYEMPRILNYLTAPNVVIWSAVAASCSIPLVYRSTPLMAKTKDNTFVPWNPSGYRFEDGSIEGDLPMQRLAELFGVNHFLVAQTNPYLIPFMKSTTGRSSFLAKLTKRVGQEVQAELQHRLSQSIDLGLAPNLLKKALSILSQKYYGDITIVPHIPWKKYLMILENPNVGMVNGYIIDGELATWPKVAILRNHCLIELCLAQNIITLREKLVNSLHQKARPTERRQSKESTAHFTIGSPTDAFLFADDQVSLVPKKPTKKEESKKLRKIESQSLIQI
ncbi:acyl transferase/acyl hydrolase/lysophospholipase [Gorgonomyces haynaldii]|nr:acyl transferase/acyl hydrolase/lysophospholipase [Gorgonomyces haynaldii]